MARAARLPRIRALIAAQEGTPIAEHVFEGPGLDHAINIRSASKAVIGALVGIAIAKGMLKSVDQPILPLLKRRAPRNLDSRVARVTIHHLLCMRAGLGRTSGRPNYEPWIQSPDWVAHILSREFVDQPEGSMIYSTGNTHLLSAILTDVSGSNTWALAQQWLGKPLGITIAQWKRDPQGIYFGGDELLMSPRDLLRFGEMYRNRGSYRGSQVVPAEWIEASWTPRATGERGIIYGYGWFIAGAHGHRVFYAWGLGGGVVCVVPNLELTLAITRDPSSGHPADNWELHQLVTTGFIPAVMANRKVGRPSLRAEPASGPIPNDPRARVP